KSFGRALTLLRRARNYAWYLAPELSVTAFSRRRALNQLTRLVTGTGPGVDPSWPDPIVDLPPDVQAGLERAFAELERRLPPDPGIVELVRGYEPDLVVITPLIRAGSRQTD